MTILKHFRSSIFFFYLFSIFAVISADQGCDKSKCKGPIRYYEDLECTPIYGPDDNCCAIKYNCDQYKGRSKDKCYYKGDEYAIGENLKDEHSKSCDSGCVCSEGYAEGIPARFTCPVKDEFQIRQPGCYLKADFENCCSGPQIICPEKDKDLATCEVDGKTYHDGERFYPGPDPTLSCICSEGYTGQNVAPFCRTVVGAWSCNIEFHHPDNIYDNCPPTYYSEQNPATECSLGFRCQNARDKIIAVKNSSVAAADLGPDMTCVFGGLTLKIGEELNQGTHYDSVCMKCVCEVPPTLTCKRPPDSECDVSIPPNFDDSDK